MSRTWRVACDLHVPKAIVSQDKTLVHQSRLEEQSQHIGELLVAIRKSDRLAEPREDERVEVVELVTDVSAADIQEALAIVGPVFEGIVDLMSFQMAAALKMGHLSIDDVTRPVEIGEEREMGRWASTPFDPNARAVGATGVAGLLHGLLPGSVEVGNSKIAAALRWFGKSLANDQLHDQFIFLWIALEILSDASDVRVTEPFRCTNDHVIEKCDECQAPTEKLVRGATLRAYLEQSGTTADGAKELWSMRQLMHGAIPFDSAKLESLGILTQILRAAVSQRLKDRLGIPANYPPASKEPGRTFHPGIALGGTSRITAEDIEPLPKPPLP
jgi:hypothetical protein